MSGTSMDAVDAALVNIEDNQIKLIDYRQIPISGELNKSLKSVTRNSDIDFITRLDVHMGRLFADAALALIHDNKLENTDIAAIGCHGQTLLHRPEQPDPTSLQVGDPNIIAYHTGITTVADFRRMDIAAGGQGAPLAPLLHKHLFRHPKISRSVVNIGGMANITMLPAMQSDFAVRGFDTGPGNVLLDAWAHQHTGRPFDTDGHWAASGTPDLKLLEYLLGDDYFFLKPPKSTGRDYFNLHWLQERLGKFGNHHAPHDIQATLVQFTAASIANALTNEKPSIQEVFVCGGGAHNPQILHALARRLPACKVDSTIAAGIDPDALEAMTFAWLARCRINGIAGNIPAVTGATAPVLLGCIYLPHELR